jgi:hypothetical protein
MAASISYPNGFLSAANVPFTGHAASTQASPGLRHWPRYRPTEMIEETLNWLDKYLGQVK